MRLVQGNPRTFAVNFAVATALLFQAHGLSAQIRVKWDADGPSNLRNVRSRVSGRAHYLLRGASGLEELREVQRFDEAMVVVEGREGLQREGLAPFRPADKLSRELTKRSQFAKEYLVEFHADVERNEAEAVILDAGLELRQHPDLAERHVLVRGSFAQIRKLAEWDEVAYVFPASAEISRGDEVRPCANLTSPIPTVTQYVATVGEGWDGPGRGGADLKYAYGRLTSKVPRELLVNAVQRALEEWRRAGRLTFTFTDQLTEVRTLAFSFASGWHGDPYPFDGRGRVLAHTFFPAGVNPEPIAGDLHLDEDENWQIGADTDVFSVVLHELGHALGLGHGDRPGTVMYPYYSRYNQLAVEDIASLQLLYAAPEATATAPVAPLAINTMTALSTTAGTIDLTGQTTGGDGEVRMSWRSSTGQSGTPTGVRDWRISGVTLPSATTTVSVTAKDATGASTTATVVVTKTATAPAPSADRTAPSIYLRSPTSSTVYTRASTMRVAGSATDNVGVAAVTWTTSTGASGVATGTVNWEVAAVPLLVGNNLVSIRAADAAGNFATRVITIIRQP